MATLTFVKPWPNGEVKYYIDSSLRSQESLIKQVINEIQTRTLVTFNEARKNDKNILKFINGEGEENDKNVVQLYRDNNIVDNGFPIPTSDFLGAPQKDCNLHLYWTCRRKKDRLLHEILHALGFIHPFQRRDGIQNYNYFNYNFESVLYYTVNGSGNDFNTYPTKFLDTLGLAPNPYSTLNYSGGDWGDGEVDNLTVEKIPDWHKLTPGDVRMINIFHLKSRAINYSYPKYLDLHYESIWLNKTADNFSANAGEVFCGVNRFAAYSKYVAAFPTFEGLNNKNSIIMLGELAEVKYFNYEDLNLENPTVDYWKNVGIAIGKTYDALSKDYLAAFPTFMLSCDGEKNGVVLIRKNSPKVKVIEVATSDLKDLGGIPYDAEDDKIESIYAGDFIRGTHRYAKSKGYYSGMPLFSNVGIDSTLMKVLVIEV